MHCGSATCEQWRQRLELGRITHNIVKNRQNCWRYRAVQICYRVTKLNDFRMFLRARHNGSVYEKVCNFANQNVLLGIRNN